MIESKLKLRNAIERDQLQFGLITKFCSVKLNLKCFYYLQRPQFFFSFLQ